MSKNFHKKTTAKKQLMNKENCMRNRVMRLRKESDILK